jgi:hypothetical protein
MATPATISQSPAYAQLPAPFPLGQVARLARPHFSPDCNPTYIDLGRAQYLTYCYII